MELQQLASKLPWTNALEVWKLNGSLKKKKGHRRGGGGGGAGAKVKASCEVEGEQLELLEPAPAAEGQRQEDTPAAETQDSEDAAPEAKLIKFRVTCNRAGDKHSFSSNEAARDFGGAVQEFFQWKADMTKFDVEVGVACPDSTPERIPVQPPKTTLQAQINCEALAGVWFKE